ncbi:hypothetical protein NVP1171O_86 [Vibrio phage 1.171.O._10N.261.52.F12]|nr:hypothetical protein NVP1171O_86 [Vibrio phage 1.171.O._10N.261.52.F12]
MEYPDYNHRLTLRGNLIEHLDANNTFSESQLFDLVIKQILKADELHKQVHGVTMLLASNDAFTDNVLTSVHKLLARPDATQPQLSEIRYVLHGDIQPCTVLYSDDTTTLLRLDEGDIMCETDTIEWSDSVTYRCQELLKSESVRKDAVFVKHATPVFAQLVRDERILLNDNGDDVVKPQLLRDDELSLNAETLWCCTECHHKFHVSLDLCPQCHTPKEH